MKIVENRLSLHRRQCEERRRYLAELESLAQRLRADGGRLRAEIEQSVADGGPVSARPLLQRHDKLARSLAAIESQIAAAADALGAAARDLKRHEQAAAQHAHNAKLSDKRRSPRARQAASPLAGPDRGG